MRPDGGTGVRSSDKATLISDRARCGESTLYYSSAENSNTLGSINEETFNSNISSSGGFLASGSVGVVGSGNLASKKGRKRTRKVKDPAKTVFRGKTFYVDTICSLTQRPIIIDQESKI